jgi:hypothetical protein
MPGSTCTGSFRFTVEAAGVGRYRGRVRAWRIVGTIGLLVIAAGCGGGSRSAGSGVAATGSAASNVEVAGQVAERGTRGSVLVFAYTDLAAGEAPAGREPASIGTLAADGSFDLSVPGGGSLTLVFLADGSNDGVVDDGDPIATLNSQELANLQAGDRVQVGDAKVDFTSHRVTATVDVTRPAGQAARTPTAVPAQ